ncbi:tetratricopeptide repeat protein [uncultured Sphingomonas sp.]|uniref:tetratricopeptide repeat protein n=1 Tax=uncultured Sphingomonas sp. TaxID=158754 RepID=UPI0025F81FAF|nr:tetratricopeptide repeat protein [uncultured Sphingomonas sp.]
MVTIRSALFRRPPGTQSQPNPVRAVGTASVAALAALLLVACESNTAKADKWEALYDRLYSVRAYPPAARAIQTAVGYDESSARRWLKVGQVREALGQYNAAVAGYQHALDLQPDNIPALQSLAIMSIRGGDFDGAQRFFQPLLLLDPDNLAGLLTKGAAALGKRDFATTDQVTATVTRLYPAQADGYVLRARMLDMQGKTSKAARLLEQRAKLDPQNADLLTQLMVLYRASGNRTGMQATAIRLLPLFPDDPKYGLDAARAYQARGNTRQAERIVDGMQARFGNSPSVMAAIASFWRGEARPEVARDRIIKAANAAKPTVRTALARTLVDMGEAASAAALLTPLTADAITTQTLDRHALMARALLASGHVEQAEGKLNDVLAFDSANPEALIVRARLELDRKQFEQAANTIQQVIADDETNEEAALLLGRIYVQQGNQLRAASAFGTARQHFPDSLAVAKAEIDWLLQQNRIAEAGQRASGFLQAHSGRSDAWRLSADTCRATGDKSCERTARAALARSGL